MEQKRSTTFFEVKDGQVADVYNFLSNQEPEQPKGENLVAVIGDIHGDLYTMLRSLVRYGIIKINKRINNGVTEYQIEEGKFRKQFKRVIFLGDYVDRGSSSPQCINNVIMLNELFNEGDSDGKDDFMKFLCGNHDTLGYMSLMDAGIRQKNKGIGQQSDAMYYFGLIRLGKGESKTQEQQEFINKVESIIERFYKALSVAHVEELSGNKRVYFTHGYCTKDVKNDFDSYLSGVYPYTFNKGSVNSLDLTSGDLENGGLESKIESLHKYFWIREFEEEGAIAKPSQNSNDGNEDLTVCDKECRVRDRSELFIHGHDRMCCEELSTAQDRFDANVGCTKRQLAECGAASMDYGNSAGYRARLAHYERKTHASSCMVIDQDGNFTISGTASSLREESKFVGKEFQVNGFSGCTFDPKDKRLAKQKEEITQMKKNNKYAWRQIISAIKNNEKIKKILETYGNIDSLKCKSDGDIVNGQYGKDELSFIIGNYEIKIPIKNRYKDAYSLTQYVGTAPDIIVSPSLHIGKSYDNPNPIREITYKYSSELNNYENTVKFSSTQQDKIAILFKNYSELNGTWLHNIKFHLEESDGNNYICFQTNSKNYRIKVGKNFDIDKNTQIECASSGQEYVTLKKDLSTVELGSDLYTGMQQNSYIAPSVPAPALKSAPALVQAPRTDPVSKPVVSTAKPAPAPAPRTDPAAPAISHSMLNQIIEGSKKFFYKALNDEKSMKKIHILEYKNNAIQQNQIKPEDLKNFQSQDKYFTLRMKVGEDKSKKIAINFKENKVLYYNEQKAELLKELSRIQRKEYLDSLRPTSTVKPAAPAPKPAAPAPKPAPAPVVSSSIQVQPAPALVQAPRTDPVSKPVVSTAKPAPEPAQAQVQTPVQAPALIVPAAPVEPAAQAPKPAAPAPKSAAPTTKSTPAQAQVQPAQPARPVQAPKPAAPAPVPESVAQAPANPIIVENSELLKNLAVIDEDEIEDTLQDVSENFKEKNLDLTQYHNIYNLFKIVSFMTQINDNIEDKLRSQDLPKNAIIYEYLMLNDKYISLFEECCNFIYDNAEKGINLEYLDQLIGLKSLDLDKYLKMLTADQKSLPFLVKELCQPLESFFRLEPHIIFLDSSHEREFDKDENNGIDSLLDSFDSLKDIIQLKQEDLVNLSFLSYIKEKRSCLSTLMYSMQTLAEGENVNIEQKTMLTNLFNKFHFVESIIRDVYYSENDAEKIKISQILYKNIDMLNFLLNGKNNNSETMIKDICDSNTDTHKQIDNFMQDFYNNFKSRIEKKHFLSWADEAVWKKEEENYQLQLNKSLSQRTSTLAPKSAPAPIVPAAPVEPAASAQAPKTVVSTAKPAPVQAPKSAPAPIVPAAPVEPAVPALKPVVSTAKPAPVPATKPVVSTAKPAPAPIVPAAPVVSSSIQVQPAPAPAPRTDPSASAISAQINKMIQDGKKFFNGILDHKIPPEGIYILKYKSDGIQKIQIKPEDLKNFQSQDKYFALSVGDKTKNGSKKRIAINFKQNKVFDYNKEKQNLRQELLRIHEEYIKSLRPVIKAKQPAPTPAPAPKPAAPAPKPVVSTAKSTPAPAPKPAAPVVSSSIQVQPAPEPAPAPKTAAQALKPAPAPIVPAAPVEPAAPAQTQVQARLPQPAQPTQASIVSAPGTIDKKLEETTKNSKDLAERLLTDFEQIIKINVDYKPIRTIRDQITVMQNTTASIINNIIENSDISDKDKELHLQKLNTFAQSILDLVDIGQFIRNCTMSDSDEIYNDNRFLTKERDLMGEFFEEIYSNYKGYLSNKQQEIVESYKNDHMTRKDTQISNLKLMDYVLQNLHGQHCLIVEEALLNRMQIFNIPEGDTKYKEIQQISKSTMDLFEQCQNRVLNELKKNNNVTELLGIINNALQLIYSNDGGSTPSLMKMTTKINTFSWNDADQLMNYYKGYSDVINKELNTLQVQAQDQTQAPVQAQAQASKPVVSSSSALPISREKGKTLALNSASSGQMSFIQPPLVSQTLGQNQTNPILKGALRYNTGAAVQPVQGQHQTASDSVLDLDSEIVPPPPPVPPLSGPNQTDPTLNGALRYNIEATVQPVQAQAPAPVQAPVQAQALVQAQAPVRARVPKPVVPASQIITVNDKHYNTNVLDCEGILSKTYDIYTIYQDPKSKTYRALYEDIDGFKDVTLYGYDKDENAFFKIKNLESFFRQGHYKNGLILKETETRTFMKTKKIKITDKITLINTNREVQQANAGELFKDYKKDKQLIKQPIPVVSESEQVVLTTPAEELVVPSSSALPISREKGKTLALNSASSGQMSFIQPPLVSQTLGQNQTNPILKGALRYNTGAAVQPVQGQHQTASDSVLDLDSETVPLPPPVPPFSKQNSVISDTVKLNLSEAKYIEQIKKDYGIEKGLNNSGKTGVYHAKFNGKNVTLYGYDEDKNAFFKIKNLTKFFEGKCCKNGIILKGSGMIPTTHIKTNDKIICVKSGKIIEEGKVQKIFNDYTKRKPLIEQPGLEIEETTRATSVSLDSDISNSEKSSRNSQVSEDDQTYQTTDSDTTSESISSPSTISATSQATMKEIQSVNGNKQVGVLPVEASPSNSQEDQKVKKKRRWGIF